MQTRSPHGDPRRKRRGVARPRQDRARLRPHDLLARAVRRTAQGRRSKDIHNEVAKAAAELKLAANKLTAKPKKKGHKFRKFLIGTAVVGGAILGAKKLMGKDQDEFDYEP